MYHWYLLFQIPQRYRFSSKSQRKWTNTIELHSCFRYHKGTDFQANHNKFTRTHAPAGVVLDTTKVQIFKQITTVVVSRSVLPVLFQIPQRYRFSSKSQPKSANSVIHLCCFRYHKGTDFQANHNACWLKVFLPIVVLDTTKVQIFKQITTSVTFQRTLNWLFQIPQRYRFSSKSQHVSSSSFRVVGCFRYHKGTDFQANHNHILSGSVTVYVVLDTTKVQIFKQITTETISKEFQNLLFQIPQRYRFSSKSQLRTTRTASFFVVLDTTKVQIFKQITTCSSSSSRVLLLFQIPQRYRFSSKSQHDSRR